MAHTELTSTQVAKRLDVSPATVRLWCSQGRFKAARRVEHPRGDYWVIPESELATFTPPKVGRPPKLSETPAPAKAGASSGGSTSKKKGGKK